MSEQLKKEMFTVDKGVLVAVLNYLAEKPFKETNMLIQAIQTSAKLVGAEQPTNVVEMPSTSNENTVQEA